MGTHQKGPPQTTINLAEEVEGGADALSRLPSRLKRYAAAHDRALVNLIQVRKRVNILKESDPLCYQRLVKVMVSMTDCGNFLLFRHYYTVDKVRLAAARFCKVHLLCPLCAIRRGSKMLVTLLQRYAVIIAENPGLKMSMLTLTVKNGEDLSERHDHLKKSYQRLLERRRDHLRRGTGFTEFVKCEGLVGSYEVTNRGHGWHPHLHLMVLHHYRIDAAALKVEWKSITGDSSVLRIDPARHPEDPVLDFLEICKYSLKFSDLTPAQNLEAYEILRGRRLVVSAGLFWGVDLPEDLTDEPLEDLPYFEMLYRYVVGSGYNFVPSIS